MAGSPEYLGWAGAISGLQNYLNKQEEKKREDELFNKKILTDYLLSKNIQQKETSYTPIGQPEQMGPGIGQSVRPEDKWGEAPPSGIADFIQGVQSGKMSDKYRFKPAPQPPSGMLPVEWTSKGITKYKAPETLSEIDKANLESKQLGIKQQRAELGSFSAILGLRKDQQARLSSDAEFNMITQEYAFANEKYKNALSDIVDPNLSRQQKEVLQMELPQIINDRKMALIKAQLWLKQIGQGSDQTQPPPQAKTGGQIMTDKYGKRAMVYPDGSYEEIK